MNIWVHYAEHWLMSLKSERKNNRSHWEEFRWIWSHPDQSELQCSIDTFAIVSLVQLISGRRRRKTTVHIRDDIDVIENKRRKEFLSITTNNIFASDNIPLSLNRIIGSNVFCFSFVSLVEHEEHGQWHHHSNQHDHHYLKLFNGYICSILSIA